MKIAICGSLDFSREMKGLADEIEKLGFQVEIPISARKILSGEFSLEEVRGEKEDGKSAARAIKHDAIRAYWEIIKNADAVLVANFDKKGVKGYVGGNSFLEMGFAHVLEKKIFLINDIPDMIYTDKMEAMQPVILNGDMSKIRE